MSAAECTKCGTRSSPASRLCPACGGETREACVACGRFDGLHNAWCETFRPRQTPAPEPATTTAEPPSLRGFFWSLAVAWALGLLVDHIDVETAQALLRIAEERERNRKKN